MAKRFVIALVIAVALSAVFANVASAGYINCDDWISGWLCYLV